MSKNAKGAAVGVIALIGLGVVGIGVIGYRAMESSLPADDAKTHASAPKLVNAIGLEATPAPTPAVEEKKEASGNVASAFGQAMALGQETKPAPKTAPAPGSEAPSNLAPAETSKASDTLDLGVSNGRTAQLETRHATSLSVRQASPGVAAREKPKDTDSPITFETQMH